MSVMLLPDRKFPLRGGVPVLVSQAEFLGCCCPPPETCENIYLDSYSVSDFLFDIGDGWFEKLRIPGAVVVNKVISGATPCEWFRLATAPSGSEYWNGSAWVSYKNTITYSLKLITTPQPVWRLTADTGNSFTAMEKLVGQFPTGSYRGIAVARATVS